MKKASRKDFGVRYSRECGLGDWQIESAKLYQPDLGNAEPAEILCKTHDLREH